MTDRELLELIAAKVGGLETGVDSMATRMDKVEKSTARTELMIENDVKPKIEALFDGYVQHSEQLARIEKEVSKQEEFILQRVK